MSGDCNGCLYQDDQISHFSGRGIRNHLLKNWLSFNGNEKIVDARFNVFREC